MNIKKRLMDIKRNGLLREFRTINSSCSDVVRFKGKECIMLASNNYFGLNSHPKVIEAAKKALERYGTGNAASRLIVNLDLHDKLEKAIAQYKGCESALVYSSGYATNIGIISSIVGKEDIVLSDELNHASIIDGCRLSKAEIKVYKHCNLNHLERLLKSSLKKIKSSKGKILIVTDSIFSMDGDIAPLKKIIELKKKHPFIFMVDDAHATGVIDTNFRDIDIHMGTLSKAFASQGGFAAGSEDLIDFLKNTSRAFMYSTCLSPANTASALAALQIIRKNGKFLKDKLLKNAYYMRDKLSKLGFKVFGQLQIIPVVVGDNKKTIQFQKLLGRERVFVTAIRPPTVPTSRLRVSVMATHTKEQLDKALEGFKKAGKKLDLI